MIKLAFFLTFDMSLEKWYEAGILSRELKLYNELSKHFRIYIISYGGETENKYKSYLNNNIEILPNKWKLHPFLYSLFVPLLYQKQFKSVDILKTNQTFGAWSAVLTKILYRKKLVIRQGFQLSQTLKRKNKHLSSFLATIVEFFAYNFADKIIVTSQNQKVFIEDKYKINKTKITVIPNYVDTELFKPLNIEKEKGRLIFVGRLDWEKNLVSLIDAVKGLDVKLILVGSGPFEDTLKEKVKQENIKNIEFKGIIPNEQLPLELNKSEIYIQPSLYEGNPKTILEAMACGLPVIATRVDGIREVITNFHDGWLCNISSQSIRRAIKHMMNDTKLREYISSNARETIVTKYSLDKLVKEEIKLYENL